MRTPKPARFPRTMPWYRSRVIVSTLVAMGAAALQRSGLAHDIAPHDLAQWTDWILLLTSMIGGGVAIHSRVNQDTAPRITGGKR